MNICTEFAGSLSFAGPFADEKHLCFGQWKGGASGWVGVEAAENNSCLMHKYIFLWIVLLEMIDQLIIFVGLLDLTINESCI